MWWLVARNWNCSTAVLLPMVLVSLTSSVWQGCDGQAATHTGEYHDDQATHTVGGRERAVPCCRAAWGSSPVRHPRPSPPSPPNPHISSPLVFLCIASSPQLMPSPPPPPLITSSSTASSRGGPGRSTGSYCLPPACYHRTSHMCRHRTPTTRGGPRAVEDRCRSRVEAARGGLQGDKQATQSGTLWPCTATNITELAAFGDKLAATTAATLH